MIEDILIVDDTDSNGVLSQLKSRRQRKSTAGERKIMHIWTDDEINRLIASVEQHRGLWDFSSPEYKLTKLDGWRSVVDDLGVDGVDVSEAKVKWSSLRTTYMVNLAKLRKKKSGQGANEVHTVTWKFFKAMMFLEDNNVQHSTSSTSTLQLESDAINHSIVEEDSVPSPPLVGNRRKRSRSITPTPSPSPLPSAGSSSSQALSILNSAAAALHSSDTNSTFCDNLLAELRTLSETRARTLRYKISRLMMDFMEASQEATPLSQVRFVSQNGRDVSVECFNTLIVEQANISSEENASALARPIPLRPSEASLIGNNDKELYNSSTITEI